MSNILIDIDGTVSEVIPSYESHRFQNAKVIEGSLQSINNLYDAGNIITFVTIRPEEFKNITELWLKSNGFKYHALIMNKPKANKYYWINNLDVHGIKYNNNWNHITDKLNEPKITESKNSSQKDLPERTIWDLQSGVNYII